MHPGQPAFLEELERSMLLLAYDDLSHAPTAELLTQAARQKTVRAPPPHRRTAAPPLPCTCELAHDLKPNLCRRASSTRLSWGRRSKPKPRCCP